MLRINDNKIVKSILVPVPMTTPPLVLLSAAAKAPPVTAFVALAGIQFQTGADWLELDENAFVEVGLSSTISLLDPLTRQPTRATVGALRQGNYQREGRVICREQLLSELAAAPVAFRALVEWDEQAKAWMVQLQD